MMQFDTERVGFSIYGRVQGVGFRWFVVTQAERLGVHGWVRNATDGSVEVRAEGAAEAIAEFRRRVAKGPPAARVSRVLELPPSNEALPHGFEVKR